MHVWLADLAHAVVVVEQRRAQRRAQEIITFMRGIRTLASCADLGDQQRTPSGMDTAWLSIDEFQSATRLLSSFNNSSGYPPAGARRIQDGKSPSPHPVAEQEDENIAERKSGFSVSSCNVS